MNLPDLHTAASSRTGFAGACLLVFLLCAGAAAQTLPVTQVGIAIEPVRAGARAAAMAESFVADAYDVASMYWNPAALAYLQDFDLQINHSQEQFIKSEDENISIPVHLRRSETIAFGASVNHVGYFASQSTVYRALQFGYDVAYAREVLPTFSVGVMLQAQYAHTSASEHWGMSSLFGFYYYPEPEVSYGVSFGGLGTGIEYFDRIDSAGSTVSHTTILRDAYTPRYLQVGATLRYPADTHDPEFVLAFANEKIFNVSGLQYKGGAEYYPWGFIALRGGYIVTPSISYGVFGWGFRTQRIHLDFAISPNPQTDQAIQISLLVALGKATSSRP
ncbi:MAG TPA: hypothetical protein VMW43_03325 [Bacteroidota bacterium]|nr:hypothetical protein [Bacteroidota bacterium]